MSRFARVITLLLSTAIFSYFVFSCGSSGDDCETSTFSVTAIGTGASFTLLEVGATIDHEITGCTTLCHTNIQATWATEEEPSSGSVTLYYYPRCGLVDGVQDTLTADYTNTSAVLSELGARNLCGDNNSVRWIVSLENNLDVIISPLTYTVTCPTE